MLLENQTAVIYGAGGAVGGAVARTFARAGATLFLPAPAADAAGLPVYRETDRAANVRFCGRFGFEVVGERAVLGVPTWFLWRAPRAAGRAPRALRVLLLAGLRAPQCGSAGPRRGWADRAPRLLDDGPQDCVGRGCLRYGVALRPLFGGDPATARPAFAQAAEIDERLRDPQQVALARVGEGRCLIFLGAPTGGTSGRVGPGHAGRCRPRPLRPRRPPGRGGRPRPRRQDRRTAWPPSRRPTPADRLPPVRRAGARQAVSPRPGDPAHLAEPACPRRDLES
jgi:hypothetical protein